MIGRINHFLVDVQLKFSARLGLGIRLAVELLSSNYFFFINYWILDQVLLIFIRPNSLVESATALIINQYLVRSNRVYNTSFLNPHSSN
jgi:hypothetical protein